MTDFSNFLNFLPPKDQYTGTSDNISQNIGDINFLDNYIPSYQITKGDIYPIIIDPSTGLATNLIGSTGPIGCTGGSIGTPAPTPFIMSTYSQALNSGTSNGGGIIQFILSSEKLLNNNTYYFASARDYTNYYNSALLYYSITSDNSVDKIVKFYDAKLINQNPTSQVKNYELYSVTNGPYDGNDGSFSAWPYTKDFSNNNVNDYDSHITRPNFQFNELLNTGTTGSINLKSGKLYHPYNIQMTYDDGTSNGYTNYTVPSGYNPGYPINFNYIYTPITNNNSIISKGFDNQPNQFNLTWPGSVSLNLYNFTSNELTETNDNFNGTSSFGVDYNYIGLIISSIGENNTTGFLNSGIQCADNNNCYAKWKQTSSNSYFYNNYATIQTGIAQYLVYQFIPIQQINTPPTNIITNYTNTYLNDNTTLPPGITFTPSNYTYINGGATGATGSFPTIIQTLYDGNTGNTGTASSNIIQSWMKNPLNTEYNCGGISQNTSYCGFTDYYDSLFGISYIYGTCGATGTDTNPYQKGECSNDGSKICVPNFKYLQNLDQYANPPYICVSKTTGISNTNLEAYINSVPIGSSGKNNGTSLVYPPYQQTQISNQTPNYGTKKETGTNYIYIGIAVVLFIILIIVIFYAILKKGNKSSFSTIGLKRLY